MCAVKLLLLFIIVAVLISVWLWKVNKVFNYMLGVNDRCVDIIKRYANDHRPILVTDDAATNIDDMVAVWSGIMATSHLKMILSFKSLADESFFSERQLKFLNGTLYI